MTKEIRQPKDWIALKVAEFIHNQTFVMNGNYKLNDGELKQLFNQVKKDYQVIDSEVQIIDKWNK